MSRAGLNPSFLVIISLIILIISLISCARQKLIKREINSKYGKISGLIYADRNSDNDNEPVGRAWIRLYQDSLKYLFPKPSPPIDSLNLISESSSDSTGKFKFSDLKPGYYLLVFDARQCREAVLPKVQVAADSVTWLNIVLSTSLMDFPVVYLPQYHKKIILPSEKEDSLQKANAW